MKIDDFVRNHRADFDDQEPAEELWEKIEKKLPTRRVTVWNSLTLWRVAAVLFLGLSVYLFVANKGVIHSEKNMTALKELQDVEDYYGQQISEKVGMIRQFQGSDGLNEFTQDFQQLEAMYMVLKEEMKARPSKKVKEALVLNLLVRIDLLNQQLKNLEEDKETREENDSQT